MITTYTLILGVVFLMTGVIGAFTGGHDHNLIIFGINTSHNLIHIFSGLAALVVGLTSARYSRIFCFVFGLVYGLVTLAGFFQVDWVVRELNLNTADNFLHLAITISTLVVAMRGNSQHSKTMKAVGTI